MTLSKVIPVGQETSSSSLQIDLSQLDIIRRIICEIQPELIISAAAYTVVDKVETEPELAMAINGIASGVIAEETKLLGAGVIHF